MILLRPYQNESIEGLRNNFKEGHIRQVLASPTGSGKSIIMLEMLRLAVAKGSRCIFICERRNLVEQFSKHLASFGIEHGVLMAGHWRNRPEALVQVASVQTLEKMDSWPSFDLMFLDELHVLMRKSVVKMIEVRPKLKIIGATATPFHPLIPKYFSAVVSVISMKELVTNGNLVPFRVFVAHEVDTKGLKVVAGDWKKDDLEKRGQQIVGDIVSDYVRISHAVHGGFRKTICFSCGISHGAELVAAFADVGVNAIQLASGVDEDFKQDAFTEFARPDSGIDMLISVDMLARGYDQTDIEHVILARPLKKSFSQHVQMVGRGARSHEGKNLCVVQDHSGNWLRFLEDWNNLYHNGIQELGSDMDKKPKKELTDKEKAAAKCHTCGCIWPPNSDTCPQCGTVRKRRNDAVTVAGEMSELTDGKLVSTPLGQKPEKFTTEYKDYFHHGLIGYLASQEKNINRAYHLYHEKFGVYPNSRKVAGPFNQEIINWVTHVNTKFAKSKR